MRRNTPVLLYCVCEVLAPWASLAPLCTKSHARRWDENLDATGSRRKQRARAGFVISHGNSESISLFLNLPETMPAYWRIALKTHGTLRGLVPYDGEDAAQKDHTPEVTYRQARAGVPRTVRVGGLWSIGRVLMEPLFYNPHLSGWWGAAVLNRLLDSPDWERLARDKKPKPKLCRWTNEREEDAREVYERSVRFAGVGVTHVVHLLDGGGLPMAWREFRRSCHPTPPCDQDEYSRLIKSLPEAWLATLRDAVLTIALAQSIGRNACERATCLGIHGHA